MPNTEQYNTDVELKFGELADMIDWCESHCHHAWMIDIQREAGQDPGLYQFRFSDERDYVTFLVWRK